MKSLVFGGAGFIGSWIADILIENGHEVAIIDNLSSGDMNNVNKNAKFYKMDIKDKEISAIFEKEKPDYVFLLAAQINVRKSIEDPVSDADVNILGSLNVISNSAKYKVKKLIFSSTGGAIYGENVPIPTDEASKENPESPYGIAKLTVEKYLKFFNKIHGLNYTVLRYSNVYGPRQNAKGEAGVVSIFINNILDGKTCNIIGDGKQTRDYVYVKDVAKANLLALNLSGTFNVGTSTETNVVELFEKIKEISGKKTEYNNVEAVKGEILRSCLDNSKLKNYGWNPEYNLDKGLKETFEYFSNLRR